MKKFILLVLTLIISISLITSCDIIDRFLGSSDNGGVGDGGTGDVDGSGDEQEPEDDPTDTPDNPENPDGPSEEKPEDKPSDEAKYTYTDFTPSEKSTIKNMLGGLIPFVPNNEYYVETNYDEYYESDCISYYTFGNTRTDFEEYLKLYSDFELTETFEDEFGDTWYCYDSELVYVELSFYYYEGDYVIDVYAYPNTDNGGSGDVGGGDIGGDTEDYLYTDFSDGDKELFYDTVGFVIPFLKTNEYYLEEYYYDYGDGTAEVGLNFYTYGNTTAEFAAYRSLFSSYTYEGSDVDDYGDSWYFYNYLDYYVDMSIYQDNNGEWVADIYVYSLEESSGGNTGSGDIGGGDVGGDTDVGYEIITNQGAGLPTGQNGIYNVDFTDATYVKDVTDQGYYLDGCPTVGSPAVLVIPVEFSDSTAASKGCSINNIVTAFSGPAGSTDYFSVDEYYYISSYGRLDLDITVIDQWFRPQYNSDYYKNATESYGGQVVEIGDQLILDEALAYLSGIMDLSKFDSDGNGVIDAVVMINTLDIGDEDFNWAYRYWNTYTDSEGYYYEYDGVSANDYLWASYFFMHESYTESGEVIYTDSSVMNTYTFIHEFGHILGADDYYDTSSAADDPLDGCDIMDSMPGDHNPYSKFNYGWITSSRLVTASDSVTLTLESFSENGDSIIIANNWDESLGAYQEYYVLIYYTSDGLNGGDFGYFARDGVVVYHVNASLCREEYDGEIYYDVYNNNTSPSDEYGSENNLIEFVKSANDTFTYIEGDRIPSVTDDLGVSLSYTFVIDSLTEDSATITFSKN